MQGGMMGGMGAGGMMGGMMGMGGGAAWAINGQSMTGDGNAGMPPLFRIDARTQLRPRLQERDRLVAPDAPAWPQLPGAQPRWCAGAA